MNRRVYFILGCTACGKAAAGQELARRLGAQIISVDSMKIYRRMNIATASPSAEIMRETPHHCVNIVEPSDGFSVADFIRCADTAIETISAADSIPLAIGGTSLYIKALSEGLFEGPSADEELRAEFARRIASEGTAKLHEELAAVDAQAATEIHPNDEKRIIRALEVYKLTGKSIRQLQQQWDAGHQRHDCVFIGLRREKESQSRRINARVKRMVEIGLVEEVRALYAESIPLSKQAAQAVGVAELIAHFEGKWDLDHALERIKINTRQLAKKQRTWHRRFTGVQWFDVEDTDTAATLADKIMQDIDFGR